MDGGQMDGDQTQRYIVILDDPPLAAYDGRELFTPERAVTSTRLKATANTFTGATKLDVYSPESRLYLQFLDERFESIRGDVSLKLGRQLQAFHRYRNALNGFATRLTAEEARELRNMPRVVSVRLDEIQHLTTDSGPAWIGADKIHDGSAGYPASGGENIVAGVFDTGINWDHPAFQDPGEGKPSGSGDWDHVNPYVSQLGLCFKSQVHCNDKLVGVYDFVVDDPGTETTEENTNGKDNIGHGSHTSSVVAGNPGYDFAPLGGVAPNANIISYRVCFKGDPDDSEDDGCQGSAILKAIDQALADGVDVVNYSIGGDAEDPWQPYTSAYGFLNLRSAGIFVATSAGNDGPGPGTVGSPANAPWLMSVGAASHDRIFANVLENMTGGDTTAPDDLYGASLTTGIGITKIVHAKDYGNALCGTGEAELQATCAGNSGVASNPFAAGTFNGEIVVCDRGTYGRVEKGKNVKTAGAAGFILANTADSPQTVVADEHCLPAIHLGRADGDKLRSWLATGTGHRGSISDSSLMHLPQAGDVLADFSSRGPNGPYASDVMKPELIAPGVDILGASSTGDGYYLANGTSFSSPHVAGAAALIKSVHPDWTPSQIASSLVLTATPELAVDYDGSIADINKRGAGRPRLDLAVNAGLYLEETRDHFIAANPESGGQPKNLNLPGLVDTSCLSCSFVRSVTDLAGGASWSASVTGVVDGLSVSVTPEHFTLADGASQQISIAVELNRVELIGQWLFGEIHLSSEGLPDAVLPLAIFASQDDLPDRWLINSDRESGWMDFSLNALFDMPDATFTYGGLAIPETATGYVSQDTTNSDPYDSPGGVWIRWFDLPAGTLLLHAETLPSNSDDLDLFVGYDANGNSEAEASEELCTSTSPSDTENCDITAPVAGRYWVLVQNWSTTNLRDSVTLKSAVVGENSPASLRASGNGIVPAGTSHQVRLFWDNVAALPGTELLGAVGIGTRRDSPNDIGVIPVRFTKTAIAAPETLVLMDGIPRGLSLKASGTHDRIVIDIPPGTGSMTVSTSAMSAHGPRDQALEMSLYRMGFDGAFTQAPFASAADQGGAPLGSASGTGNGGPTLTLTGGQVASGRWYVVLSNKSQFDLEVEIRADLDYSGSPLPLSAGLWQSSSRPGLNQGFDYSSTGDYRALLWYSYDQDGKPAWYLAAGPEPVGNVWVAELERFTNDGSLQQSTPVGHVSVTTLSEQDNVFSFVLFGEQGSDRMVPTSPPLCPLVGNGKKSYTGLWSRPAVGVGGASALVNEATQGYLHYIYDGQGNPVWLLGASVNNGLPHTEMSLLQYTGYCAVCTGDEPTSQEVGVLTMDYTDEVSATWNLDYILAPPLAGSVKRSDDVAKLTVPLLCQ